MMATTQLDLFRDPETTRSLSKSDVRQRILAARSNGRSWRQIADDLNRDGVPTVSGRGRWHVSTVIAHVLHRGRIVACRRASARVAVELCARCEYVEECQPALT